MSQQRPRGRRQMSVRFIPRASASQFVGARAAGGGIGAPFGGGFEWLTEDGAQDAPSRLGGRGGTYSPNSILPRFHDTLTRGRDIESFVPQFRAAPDKWCDEILSHSGSWPNYDRWQQLAELARYWYTECVYGETRLDMLAAQVQVVKLVKRDGQCLIRHIHQTDLARVPYSRVPYQIQILHIDHLPSWFTMPLGDGGRIVGGVEFDREGFIVAYHLFPVHPYDYLAMNQFKRFPIPIRVAANEISVVGELPEPGAVRAMPPMVAAYPAARELYEYMDAEMVRKRTMANQVLLISAPGNEEDEDTLKDVMGEEPGYGPDGETVLRNSEANRDVPFKVASPEPGGAVITPPGWKIEQTDPTDVGTSFEPFLRRAWGNAALGTGLPYGIFSDDYLGAWNNDRLYKVQRQAFSRGVKRWRKVVIENMFWRPIIRRFAIAAYLSGEWVPDADVDLRQVYLTKVDFAREEYVHPLQDAQSDQLLLQMGLISRDDLAAKRGVNAASNDLEDAVALERRRLLGLPAFDSKGSPIPIPPLDPNNPNAAMITELAQAQINRERASFGGSSKATIVERPDKLITPSDTPSNTFNDKPATGQDIVATSIPLGAMPAV